MAKNQKTVLTTKDNLKLMLAIAVKRLGGSLIVVQEDIDEVALTCMAEHQGTTTDGRPFVQFVLEREAHPTRQ